MEYLSHQPTKHMRLLLPASLTLASLLLISSCTTIEMTALTDREFLIEGVGIPFRTVLVAYDGSELVDKDAFEAAFVEYIVGNTSARALPDLELFPPLRKQETKQRAATLKDEGVDCVLVINGGGLSRPEMWSVKGKSDFENFEAWRGMQFRLVQVATGRVVWMGKSVEATDPLLVRTDLNRDLVTSVGAELLKYGFLEVKTSDGPVMRGFNR